jgi:hypothetical protein
VTRHAPSLLAALLTCCSADVWTVRDAATVATGKFVSVFPQAATKAQLEGLFSLWFEHLSEPVWSVREDSAVALGQVLNILQYIYYAVYTVYECCCTAQTQYLDHSLHCNLAFDSIVISIEIVQRSVT